jgi:competence protein ComEA
MKPPDKHKDRARCEIWALTPYELAVWSSLLLGLTAAVILQHERLPAESVVRVQSAGDARPAGTFWRLEVNTATEAELILLPGIGPRRAQAILSERRKRGAFRSVWELSEVPGLTKALVQRIEPLVQVRPPAAPLLDSAAPSKP